MNGGNAVEVVLTFARTNETIRAERLLEDAGLPVRVMPLPSAVRAGCGVCLRLPEARLREAAALLEQAAIPVQSVLRRTATGTRSVYTPYPGGTT